MQLPWICTQRQQLFHASQTCKKIDTGLGKCQKVMLIGTYITYDPSINIDPTTCRGSDLVPGANRDDIPKSMSRILGAERIRDEWKEKKRKREEEESKGGGGKKQKKNRDELNDADKKSLQIRVSNLFLCIPYI